MRVAISDSGTLGRRVPTPRVPSGGDCEFGSRGMGNVETAGELYDDEGTEPEEARENKATEVSA